MLAQVVFWCFNFSLWFTSSDLDRYSFQNHRLWQVWEFPELKLVTLDTLGGLWTLVVYFERVWLSKPCPSLKTVSDPIRRKNSKLRRWSDLGMFLAHSRACCLESHTPIVRNAWKHFQYHFSCLLRTHFGFVLPNIGMHWHEHRRPQYYCLHEIIKNV